MLLQKNTSLLSVTLIKKVKNGINGAFYNRTVVVLDIAGQVPIVCLVISWILGGNDCQRFDRPRHRYIQHTGIIYKFCNHIIHRSQNNRVFLPPLKFVDGNRFNAASQLALKRSYLIPIRCNDTNASVSFFLQVWKNFFLNHINLPLIQAATGVVSRRCPIHRQYIRLVVVSRHNDQLSAIEFLIAEINDLGVTAIMLPQQHRGCLRPCRQSR